MYAVICVMLKIYAKTELLHGESGNDGNRFMEDVAWQERLELESRIMKKL